MKSVSFRLQWQLYLGFLALDLCLLTLWIHNGEAWAKALFLGYQWFIHGVLIVSLVLLHLGCWITNTQSPRDRYPTPSLLWACRWTTRLVILAILWQVGQVALVTTMLVAHALNLLDNQLRPLKP